MIFRILSLLLFAIVFNLQAQIVKPLYHEVYPELLFSEEQIKKSGYQKVLIWYDEYLKSTEDQPGFLWTNRIKTYQWQRHNLPGGKIENSITYNDKNDRISAINYYYQNDLIAAVDDISYDSTLKEKVISSSFYTYKDSVPFQKVKIFNQDKGYRLLYDYIFDTDGRLIRSQVKPEGRPQKAETIIEASKSLNMILADYKKDTKTLRYYKNMHELTRTEKTQYNDKGFPINTKTLNDQQQMIKDVLYSYEGDQFVKETHLKYENGQEEVEKIVYIRYNLDGIMEQLVTEIGNKQIVLTLQYYTEY